MFTIVVNVCVCRREFAGISSGTCLCIASLDDEEAEEDARCNSPLVISLLCFFLYYFRTVFRLPLEIILRRVNIKPVTSLVGLHVHYVFVS